MDAKIAEEIAYHADLEIRDDYSGRGMYGEETHGLVGDMDSFVEGLIETTIMAVEDEDDELLDKLRRFRLRTDSMGLEMIFY